MARLQQRKATTNKATKTVARGAAAKPAQKPAAVAKGKAAAKGSSAKGKVVSKPATGRAGRAVTCDPMRSRSRSTSCRRPASRCPRLNSISAISRNSCTCSRDSSSQASKARSCPLEAVGSSSSHSEARKASSSSILS